jgi:ribosomal-protein-alanine N-acetyltransferase
MKIIETPRLLLRRTNIEEYHNLFENYSREEIMAYFGFTTEEQFLEEKKKYDGGITNYRTSMVYFHMIEKQSNKIIGVCAFHNWFAQHARAEIGYVIRDEENKNKGYMKEAMLAVLDYGFNEMKLHRIEAFIGTKNIASQKLVQHYGFTQEGHLRGHYCKDGVIEDSLVFGLLKSDFK